MKTETISIRTNYNETKGCLTFLESENDLPFPFKRIYYVYGVPQNETRGYHAHKCLRQMLICLTGECEIMLDNGKEKHKTLLNNPSEGLMIEPGIWHTMQFLEKQTILMVVASEHYNENDYIRDYDDFTTFVKSGFWK